MMSLFSFLILTTLSFADPKPVVMLTYFHPYDGELENTSLYVAKALKAHLSPHADVILCDLPTVYFEAPAKALDCYEKLPQKPLFVLTLGESNTNTSGEPEWESTVVNLDDSNQCDQKGVVRIGQKIAKDGPKKYVTSLFKKLRKEKMISDWSDSSLNSVYYVKDVGHIKGYYVCNHTAYKLMHEFSKEENGPLYGFVHVPDIADNDLTTLAISPFIYAQELYEQLRVLFK